MTEYKMAMTDVKKKTSFIFKLLPDETWHFASIVECGTWKRTIQIYNKRR